MQRLGKVAEFRDGLRVTDAETVDIARMVLRGQVNPAIVSAINVHGPIAVGVSWMIQDNAFQTAPTPRPMNTVLASAPPRSPLLLLRVFKPSGRSEAFMDRFLARWRFAAPVWMIGGPDLAAEVIDAL